MTTRRAARGNRLRRALGALLAALPLVPGVGVQAQEASTPQSADSTLVLAHPELVVRALRAPVAAAELPYAVTVRRPALDASSAGLSLAGELRAVPGLQVQSRYNDALGERIVMRGFGARAQFGVRGIQVLVDGVPATMPDGQTTLSHLDLSLLERAEVLRGPAAAAYGNAAGGVLLLSTRPPPSAGLRQEVEVVGGEGDLFRLRSTTAGGGGGAGWIVSATRERRDGYRPHSGTERYQGTGRLDASMAGGFLRVVAHGVSYDADNPGSLTLEQYLAEPHQAQGYNVAQRTGEEGLHGQVGATWEAATGIGQLEATAYAVARTLDNPIPPAFIDLERRVGGARVLLRSGGGEGRASTGGTDADRQPVSWAVGLEAAVQRDDRQNHENVDGRRGTLTLDQGERVSNVAVHGQALVPILPPLGVFLGARYDRISFAADDHFTEAGDPDDSGRRTMHAVSPTAGLRLDVARGVSFFGNVSTAFETPTTTELVNRPDGSGGFNAEVDPQRTISYEIGTRAEIAPMFRFQASAYHARVTDALIPFEVATAPGRQYFRNAGGAVHEGLELLAEVRTSVVEVLGAVSWTEAGFTAYEEGGRSFDGNAVPGVRPWTVGLVAKARPTATLRLEVDYEGTGAMAVDDANESWAPGYDLVGVRVAATGISVGRGSLAPYIGVGNLLDEVYVASVVPNAFGGRFFEPGPGRSVYLGMELEITVRGAGQ